MGRDVAPRTPVRTTCPYCGVGCGVLVERTVGGFRVRGDPEHPANRGRLCSKGAALGETLGEEGRLLRPVIGGRAVGWDEALDAVAAGFRRVIDAHGPDAVAFYVSGQLLTEDYYVANKLMKGFIGSANIDTNSRLCMSTPVAAQTQAFGEDAVPGCYEDPELADLVVLVGSNAAWTHPVLFQRLAAAREARPEMRVVVVDPRRTATCELADLHLPLRPGTDAFLFTGLFNHLRRHDALDWAYIEAHTEGFAATLEAARESCGSIPETALRCGLPEQDVAGFFRLFAAQERTVTLFSQGVNQSASGVDKVLAILNVHLATGRIGRPGMGPFSLTGQPNAMGGREVGGLATQLAAHMGFDDPEHVMRVGRFWNAPNMASRPGLKAVDLFRAVGGGRIKALWIMGTNPMVSMPDADTLRTALGRCELVVVSDCMADTDTLRQAHVRLPAATWGEREGTVTNSERCISRQRAFTEPPGDARPDWWIICQVARRMGFGGAFAYESPAEIFREHARLSGLDNGGNRAFDISALAPLDAEGYAALAPVQWPVTQERPEGTARLFGDGRFRHPGARGRLLPVVPGLPATATDGQWPLVLNTGRTRDQWHTMTRTARTARLTTHLPEPVAEIHPDDARAAGLADGMLVRVESPRGHVLVRARVSRAQRPGSVFVPIHWNDCHAGSARVGALVAPITDPVSGQPEFKHTPVAIRPWPGRWHAFLLTGEPVPAPPEADYWVRTRAAGHWRLELAGRSEAPDWHDWGRRQLGRVGEWLEFDDPGGGTYRAARVVAGRLRAALFVGPDHTLPPRDWLGGLFVGAALPEAARAALLAGRPAGGAESGPTVCACFGVGLNTLKETIRLRQLGSVEAVGAALQAGTGCGSCLPEIRALLPAQSTQNV
ncbi:nitrate reductase [Thioalkalivibrio denitrificans]|uniref:nitrate reductase (cytochrome) n=1 Tax=Thioalkalivibrio denitrificans TaxID=108003 RepID=A0A1V3NPM4_9GAMM|nr:nitrate reductase [Thioalkalivibrio denitrificans]OOG26828.1 nitrate reductase [Thioalkalivibrio denitrificans]